MIYFTSDLHLGHANCIQMTHRPFETVEEMNRVLIENINTTVGENDELWILGDFAYKVPKSEVPELRAGIRCRHVHLVNGNHDRDYSDLDIFESVQDYKQLKTPFGRFILFHYPMMEWNAAHYGSVHLHGHIHSTGAYNAENMQKRFADRFPGGHFCENEDLRLRIWDVGVDANAFKPISLEEIARIMEL